MLKKTQGNELDQDVVIFYLSGNLDENFDFKEMTFDAKSVVFDFNSLVFFNSVGIRDWINYLKSLPVVEVVYRNCPRILVDQFNMIEGFFTEKTKVRSVYAPFYCPESDEEIDILIDIQNNDHEKVSSMLHPISGKYLEFDDIPEQYFSFLRYLPPE